MNHRVPSPAQFGAPALALVVLLSSLVGSADHRHGAATERGIYECAVDHATDAHGGSGSDLAEVRSPGQRHRHDCIGCHFTGNRSLLIGSRVLGADRRPQSELLASVRLRTSRSLLWDGRTLRGPPFA